MSRPTYRMREDFRPGPRGKRSWKPTDRGENLPPRPGRARAAPIPAAPPTSAVPQARHPGQVPQQRNSPRPIRRAGPLRTRPGGAPLAAALRLMAHLAKIRPPMLWPKRNSGLPGWRRRGPGEEIEVFEVLVEAADEAPRPGRAAMSAEVHGISHTPAGSGLPPGGRSGRCVRRSRGPSPPPRLRRVRQPALLVQAQAVGRAEVFFVMGHRFFRLLWQRCHEYTITLPGAPLAFRLGGDTIEES